MNYTIKQISNMTQLPASTLRYYEKEQLLPAVTRNEYGYRVYDDHDLDWISIITCLRDTNMPIIDIKKFVALCALGDETLETRRAMIIEHKHAVEKQMEILQQHMNHINHKIDYYDNACEAGTEAVVKGQKCNASFFL